MGFFDTNSDPVSQSTLAPWQQKVGKQVSAMTQVGLKVGATDYTGKLVADTPEMFRSLYDNTLSNMGAWQTAISDAITGKPAYQFDSEQATKDWETNFATPVMAAWKRNVLPTLNESMNTPGSYWGSQRGAKVNRDMGNFYNDNVASKLFDWQTQGRQMEATSRENAAARRSTAPGQIMNSLAGLSDSLQAKDQAVLSAAYSEFMRMAPENNPWIKIAMGFMTNNTRDNAVVTTPSMFGQITGAAASLISAFNPK
jgi:hypothetical protein